MLGSELQASAADMEKVGLLLQKTALSSRQVPDDFDLFGRSAFNRYYYSVFLMVRSLILEFNPSWSASHSSIPDMLTTSVHKELSRYRSKILKKQDSPSVEVINRGIAALSQLSSMMKVANATRVTADYNPAIRIEPLDQERFRLGTATIQDAHNWTDQAKTLTATIRRAWRLARGGF